MSAISDTLARLPIKSGQLFIVMAIVMAILSGLVFKTMMTSQTAVPAKAAEIETLPIVVSAESLPVGSVITTDALKVVQWPKSMQPAGATFSNPNELVGRVVKNDLLPGDLVYKEKLAGENSSGGLPVLIPNGMRAISVATTEVKEVAGFIRPGDHVDVLGTFEDSVPDPATGSNKTIKINRTVLQNVLVVAIAQDMVKEKINTLPDAPSKATADVSQGETDKSAEVAANTDKKEESAAAPIAVGDKPGEKKEDEKETAKLVASVTLALSPADAQKLALAEDTGSIRLLLRGELDRTAKPVTGVNNVELLTGDYSRQGRWPFKASPPVQTAALPKMAPLPKMAAPDFGKLMRKPPGASVEFIEGGEKTTLDF